MITVRTNDYINSHLKSPRGYGHWAFWMGTDTSDINKAVFFTGTYTDALKKAKAKAKEVGATTITVGA